MIKNILLLCLLIGMVAPPELYAQSKFEKYLKKVGERHSNQRQQRTQQKSGDTKYKYMISGKGNDKEYVCSGCGQRFSDYSVMRSHENAVHDF